MPGKIEISARDVTDVEGRVLAQYIGGSSVHGGEPVTLQGTLRGPFCKNTRTLPAEIKFRNLDLTQPGLAEALVPDPCIWSPELPHLYQADIIARQGDNVFAEYHGMIGLRGSEPNE